MLKPLSKEDRAKLTAKCKCDVNAGAWALTSVRTQMMSGEMVREGQIRECMNCNYRRLEYFTEKMPVWVIKARGQKPTRFSDIISLWKPKPTMTFKEEVRESLDKKDKESTDAEALTASSSQSKRIAIQGGQTGSGGGNAKATKNNEGS